MFARELLTALTAPAGAAFMESIIQSG